MPTKAEQLVMCLALALAAAAAMLSAQPNRMHQMAQWLMEGTASEAAAIAGAIGESPDVLQAR
jgi:DNA-binding transcriptional regulator YdaS (Cro superfamily)